MCVIHWMHSFKKMMNLSYTCPYHYIIRMHIPCTHLKRHNRIYKSDPNWIYSLLWIRKLTHWQLIIEILIWIYRKMHTYTHEALTLQMDVFFDGQPFLVCAKKYKISLCMMSHTDVRSYVMIEKLLAQKQNPVVIPFMCVITWHLNQVITATSTT